MRIFNVRDLGIALRESRQTYGVNQQDLAVRVGVSRNWVSTVEAGTSNPGFRQVLAALEALNLTIRIERPTPVTSEPQGNAPTMSLDEILEQMDRAAGE